MNKNQKLENLKLSRCVLVIGVFCVCFAYFVVTGYRSDQNFGYVMVRTNSSTDPNALRVRVLAQSPWGTKTEMIAGKGLVWEIPRFEKRVVKEIIVASNSNEPIPEVRWELSITDSPAPEWHLARANRTADGLILLPGPDLVPGSLFPSRRSVINWMGDTALFLRSVLYAMVTLALAAVTMHMGRRAPAIWRTRISARLVDTSSLRSDRFPNRGERFFLWALVIAGVVFGIANGLRMSAALWPGLHDDGVYYTTIILNRCIGAGNAFAVYTPGLMGTHGSTTVASHGQLYQAAMATTLRAPSYNALLYSLHCINLLTFVLAMASFSISTRRALQTSWLAASLVALPGAYSIFAVLHYLQGRPEHGIPLVLLTFVLIREIWRRESLPEWAQGIQIGIVAAISPYAGGIFGIANVLALSLRSHSFFSCLKSTILLSISTVLSWASLTAMVYSGSLIDLVKNTSAAGKTAYTAIELGAIADYWWDLNLAPGLGVFFAVSLLAAVFVLIRKLCSSNSLYLKAFLVCSSLPLAYAIWTNGIAYAGFHYSVIGFLPSLLIWTPRALTDRSTKTLSLLTHPAVYWSRCSIVLPTAIIALLAYPSLGFVRTALLQNAVSGYGVSFHAASERIEDVKKTLGPGDVIMIDGFKNARSAVVFDGPPWRFRSKPDGDLQHAEKMLTFSAKYYLVLQYSDDPPVVPGFELFEDAFTRRPVYFGYQLLSWFTPGYGYALYARNSANDAQDLIGDGFTF